MPAGRRSESRADLAAGLPRPMIRRAICFFLVAWCGYRSPRRSCPESGLDQYRFRQSKYSIIQHRIRQGLCGGPRLLCRDAHPRTIGSPILSLCSKVRHSEKPSSQSVRAANGMWGSVRRTFRFIQSSSNVHCAVRSAAIFPRKYFWGELRWPEKHEIAERFS